MEDEIQIRKVAFGGYHRGDVERVLSRSGDISPRHEQLITELRAENQVCKLKLQQMQEENDNLSRIIARKDETIQELREENNQLRQQVEELGKAGSSKAASQFQLDKLRQQLEMLDSALEGDQDALRELSGEPM
jgi:chromosome segregation ATPase